MQRILEVVSASTTQDLTLLATVKTHLGITGSSSDTVLAQVIKRASDAIANACNRVFGSEQVRETLFLENCVETIVLKRYPVTAIASVVEDGTTLASANYLVDKDTGKLFRLDDDGDKIEWPDDKIVITYTGGYLLLATLPYDIEDACLSMVSHLWSTGSRDPMAKRIEIPDVQTVDYWVGGVGEPGKLPPEVEAKIAPYKNWNI